MSRSRSARGAVTAEAALVLPVLVAITLALVWLVSLAATQVRLVDAARETARAAARGESASRAVERGHAVAPGAEIQVSLTDDQVTVSVRSAVVGPGGLLSHLPGARLSATAVAVREQG